MTVDVIHPIAEKPKVALPPDEDVSYLILIQEVVAQVLKQMDRISEKNRLQTEHQKHIYTKANQNWSDDQRTLGNIGWYSMAATLGLMSLPILLQGYVNIPEADKPFLDLFTQKGPDNIANMVSSRTQATQQVAKSKGELAMNEMNLSANKSGTDANHKDQMIGLVHRTFEGQTRAAQGG